MSIFGQSRYRLNSRLTSSQAVVSYGDHFGAAFRLVSAATVLIVPFFLGKCSLGFIWRSIFVRKEATVTANPISLSELTFETINDPNETLVRCNGRIVSATSRDLQEKVRALIPGTKRVVLDLTNVSYMDSSGLGALVGIFVTAKRQGCELKLINLNQRLKELFRLTRLAKIFEGHEDLLGATPD
jgi:anti-sigma B factor antagonist